MQIFRCIYKSLQSKECKKPSRKLLFGLLLVLAGLLLYSFSETEENYQVRTYLYNMYFSKKYTSSKNLRENILIKNPNYLRSLRE